MITSCAATKHSTAFAAASARLPHRASSEPQRTLRRRRMSGDGAPNGCRAVGQALASPPSCSTCLPVACGSQLQATLSGLAGAGPLSSSAAPSAAARPAAAIVDACAAACAAAGHARLQRAARKSAAWAARKRSKRAVSQARSACSLPNIGQDSHTQEPNMYRHTSSPHTPKKGVAPQCSRDKGFREMA